MKTIGAFRVSLQYITKWGDTDWVIANGMHTWLYGKTTTYSTDYPSAHDAMMGASAAGASMLGKDALSFEPSTTIGFKIERMDFGA